MSRLKEEPHISHFKKLEMIELSEEVNIKSWHGLKARPLGPVSQVMNAKENLLKEIKSATPVNEHTDDKKVEPPLRDCYGYGLIYLDN